MTSGSAAPQLVTLWPADADGKLIGEDIYFGASPFANLKKIRTQRPTALLPDLMAH